MNFGRDTIQSIAQLSSELFECFQYSILSPLLYFKPMVSLVLWCVPLYIYSIFNNFVIIFMLLSTNFVTVLL